MCPAKARKDTESDAQEDTTYFVVAYPGQIVYMSDDLDAAHNYSELHGEKAVVVAVRKITRFEEGDPG